MSTKIPIETSARHIHVSQEDFRFLFGEDAQLHYTKELSQSGDTTGSPGCTLIGPKGELTIDHGVIVAKRHIHMTPADAVTLKVKDNDEVFVLTKSYGRALIYADVVVRVDWSYRLAMHVDTDEANAFSNQTEPYGVIVKFFDGNYNTDKWIEDVLSGINR